MFSPLIFQKVDKIVMSLGSEPCHGPILICWATIRLIYGDQSDLNITRKMGNQALQLRAFDLLYNLLNTEPEGWKDGRKDGQTEVKQYIPLPLREAGV
jgi:hypothetical protein